MREPQYLSQYEKSEQTQDKLSSHLLGASIMTEDTSTPLLILFEVFKDTLGRSSWEAIKTNRMCNRKEQNACCLQKEKKK